MDSSICDAIRDKLIVEYSYSGRKRLVEPHCYGITTVGNEALRAFQVGGYSSSGKMGWKLYDLSKVKDIVVLDKTFNGPRIGYKKGDKDMKRIYCEL